jgi:hypothetical protein
MRLLDLKPFDIADSKGGLIKVSGAFVRKGGQLDFEFDVRGLGVGIFWPALVASPSRVDGLYRSTCFEIFIARGPDYVEYNFSPSSDWCGFAFSSYRIRHSVDDTIFCPLSIKSYESEDHGRVEGTIDLQPVLRALSWDETKNPLMLGMSAVLKISDRTSYWALSHDGDKADFHLLSSFTQAVSQSENKDR